MKKIFSILALMVLFLTMNAQTPLPLNPAVKTGKLPNGLTYYILHNEEPKERANFYIAQKVGSTLETQDQLGLAHFLEHMAFNGTTHFPGKSMLNYLQSKGIRFGSDINAYTDFDETVYNINNVPTTDKNLMDSVLLVLHDWSGEILLEEAEIDAERGVIESEWRQRQSSQLRMVQSISHLLYPTEYQYQQLPIGSMDVVRNFDYGVIRDYYKKWYRPDQQGIVIVGDFDAAEMEKKVIELFSTIPMPENAAERVYPTVADNDKPIYATFEDPEMKNATIMVALKYDPVPFELRNTVEIYLNWNIVVENFIAGMINNRLSEYSQKLDCPYTYAGIYFGNYWFSKTKGALNINIVPKDNPVTAYKAAMEIIARAFKTGFTDSELQRVKDTLLAHVEKLNNERDKMDNEVLGEELYRHFIDNVPAPGVEAEYQLLSQTLPMIPVQAVNEMASQLLRPENEVIVYTRPVSDEPMPSMEVMVETLNNAINGEYEAYQEEKITEPFLSKLPKKGSVKKTSYNDKFGYTEMILSNGAKVIVKTTDFKSDEILFQAFREGGKSAYSKDQAANVFMMGSAIDLSKLGNYDVNTLQKYLAGKQVALSFEPQNYVDLMKGFSTKKDLATLMEIVYATFTSVTPDKDSYDAAIARSRVAMANQEKNPEFIYGQHLRGALYNGNPLMMPFTLKTLEDADYLTALNMSKEALSNAADYTFTFVGNVDVETLKPLLEQYIASLPSKGKATPSKEVTSLDIVKGIVVDDFSQPMQDPKTKVAVICSDNTLEYNSRNSILLNMTAEVLYMVYLDTLREEMGATYGAGVYGQMNPNTNVWQLIYQMDTNSKQQNEAIERAKIEMEKLFNEGTTEDKFSKVKEGLVKQYEINIKSNQYWNDQILALMRGFDTVSDFGQTLNSITLSDLNAFMKNLYNGKNRVQVVMTGVGEEK